MCHRNQIKIPVTLPKLKIQNDSRLPIEYSILSCIDTVTFLEKKQIIDFLFEQLDEYGDKVGDIEKAVEYAVSDYSHQGGLIILAKSDDNIAGAAVVLKTGMEGYIPENILVYIATHKGHRGQGIGRELMNKLINLTSGDIALHVEPENPARKLYEKIGFTNKYLEMRYHKR